MDMASAPGLTKSAHAADLATGRADAVRTLSADEAREADFIAAWRNLAGCAAEPNPFFEPWFLLPSLRAFAADRRAVFLFTTYADGRLTGLMPLGHANSYYGYPVPHAATWLHANAFYGAPLVEMGQERRFWQALFDYLDAGARPALFAHLAHLDEHGPLNAALGTVLAADGREAVTVDRQERAMLASKSSPEAYLASSLSKKHAKELRRQRRRLGEQGDLTQERRNGTFAIDEWIAEFLALEASGWKGDAGSALACDDRTRRFYSDALRGAAYAGRLERLALRLDDKPIAMLANFTSPPGSFAFKTAFDERYSAHSPGMQLQIDNLAVLERDDVEWSDSCAAEGHPMIDRLWTERRTLVTRNIAIGGRLHRALFRMLMARETRRRRHP